MFRFFYVIFFLGLVSTLYAFEHTDEFFQTHLNGATIEWNTDEDASAKVIYGLTKDCDDDSVENAELLKKHSIELVDLDSDTKYYFRMVSTNGGGTQIKSSVFAMRTTRDVQLLNNAPSAVISVTGVDIQNDSITVSKNDTVRFSSDESTDLDSDDLYATWLFGDGTTSKESNPVHIYENPGDYKVDLIIDDQKWGQYSDNPFIIPLEYTNIYHRGGIITDDANGDGLMDFIVTSKDLPNDDISTQGHIAVYLNNGQLLWAKPVDIFLTDHAEGEGLPGYQAPGISTGDVDGDGQLEIVHLDVQDSIVIRNAATGDVERKIFSSVNFSGANRWGMLQVVNLRGKGDVDLILQANPTYPSAYVMAQNKWLKAITIDSAKTLWTVDDYFSPQHNGFRAADLDGDGLDEVGGRYFIDHDGTRMNDSWTFRSMSSYLHFDAMYIADIRPDIEGLEVVFPEESTRDEFNDQQCTSILNANQVIDYAKPLPSDGFPRDGNWEPQNCAIGNYDVTKPGLEIFNRSRFDAAQTPWIYDSSGNLIADWEMNHQKPSYWTAKGIEVIYNIDWSGGEQNYIAAKERHTNGKVAIIDAMTGDFIQVYLNQADRIYVADVSGDYREEILVLNSDRGELHVYWNSEENSNPDKARYWNQNHYRRQKNNHNYYSP